MKRIATFLLILASTAIASHATAADTPHFSLELEAGPVWQSSNFAEVPAGTYTVAVTPAGLSEPIVIGPVDLDLAAATDYLVVATDVLSMITPVILTADGSTPAAGNGWVRFLHASPDAPAVDIAVADGGPVLFPNVSFQSFTEYAPVPAGTYDLEVVGTVSTPR
jgi:hypothetical protein